MQKKKILEVKKLHVQPDRRPRPQYLITHTNQHREIIHLPEASGTAMYTTLLKKSVFVNAAYAKCSFTAVAQAKTETGSQWCSCHLPVIFCHVVVVRLVGAKAFMRFLSGGISQHHLHLHSIHHPTVEQCHGLICTLKEKDTESKEDILFGVKYTIGFDTIKKNQW